MTDTIPQDFCPYKGLQPYTEADRAFFFGRERDSEIIASNLYAATLTVLYGESGVGKSSVLLAGVVPLLRQTANVAVVVFRQWQDADFASVLKAEILKAVRETSGKEADVDSSLPLDDFLVACNRVLRGPIFFIFDQFEEFFLYHAPVGGAEGFDAEWARSVNRRDVDANFLVALREDSLSRLDRFRGRLPKLMSNMLRLKHLDEEAGRTAIRMPLEKYNEMAADGQPHVEIEGTLVDELLQEIQTGRVTLGTGRGQVNTQETEKGSERIETPFLQMVLTRLWNEERAEGSHVLRLETLTRLGGAERIVRTHLDKVMEKLSVQERDVAAQLFRFLVTPSGSKIAHTTEDLISYAEMPGETVETVLTILSSPAVRILRPIAPPPGHEDGTRYEIFHDVLAQAVLDWRTRYSQEQKRLAAEKELAEERARSEAKLREAHKRTRRLRWGAMGLTVVLFAMAGLLGMVLKADRKLARAQIDSHSRELAAYSKDNSDYDPDLSILLAIEAASISMTTDAIDALKKALAAEQTKFLLTGHTAALRGAAFSPDGKYVATSSFDKTARVWDMATGKPVSILGEHQNAVMNVSFSPDGQFIATACQDKKVRVWADWQTNAPRVIAVREEPASLFSATFSPDGRHLLITSVGFLYDWEWKAGESSPQRQWQITKDKENSSVWDVVFSPDGNNIVAGTQEGIVVLDWNAAAGVGSREPTWLSPKNSSFRVAFSHDGKYIAGRCADNITCVWDWKNPPTPTNPVVLNKSMIGVQGVAFSPDDKIVSNGQRDGTVLLWNWGKATAKYSGKAQMLLGHVGENSTIFSLTFSPDGRFLVSTSEDKTARIWLLKGFESKEELEKMTPQQLLDLARTRVVRPFTTAERERYIEEAEKH